MPDDIWSFASLRCFSCWSICQNWHFLTVLIFLSCKCRCDPRHGLCLLTWGSCLVFKYLQFIYSKPHSLARHWWCMLLISGGSLRVPGQPGLQSKFQNSQGYTEKPCLRKKKIKQKTTFTYSFIRSFIHSFIHISIQTMMMLVHYILGSCLLWIIGKNEHVSAFVEL